MDAAALLLIARARAGLGLRELAAAAGTSHATLAAYEAGRKEPRLSTLERILRAAGFTVEATLSRRPDASPAEREAKAAELVEALELAAAFPARHDAVLRYPRFPAPSGSP